MKEKNFLKKMLFHYDVQMVNIVNSGNIVNTYCQTIYVINLEKNVIRRNYICTLMKKYGIHFKLVIVKKVKEKAYEYYCKYDHNISIGELGCGLSHLWCLKDIIKNNYKNAIIFEDDIIFHKHFETRFLHIMEKQNYDFLMLGACDYHFSEVNYKNVHKKLYRPNSNCTQVYGAHAIYYSLEGATYMFHYKLNEFAFFDYNLNQVFSYFENTSFICYPNLVVTDITTTDNNHSYDLFSPKEKTLYSKCFVHFPFNNYSFIYLNLLDESCIDTFDNYKDYLCWLFNKKYPEKTGCIQKFINRIDFDFFTLEDIRNIFSTSSLLESSSLESSLLESQEPIPCIENNVTELEYQI
jgi:GR25 family glycosyltransferase involved in LPS biosynthesis